MSTQVSWEISPAEFQSNNQQFAALNPQLGKLDGVSVRNVLMKSNLPPPTLAQIWALSDLDRDGMLDIREFSIAMRLTRNCLAGAQLPPSLPQSLLQVPSAVAPAPVPAFPMAASGYGMPQSHPMAVPGSVPIGMSTSSVPTSSPLTLHGMQQSMPPAGYGAPPAPPLPARPGSAHTNGTSVPATPTSAAFPGKQCANWTIPHQMKLKYSQQFNQLDKQRVGFLNGQAARSALGLSGLPTHTLAHIWNLSDVNKDGRLNVDEFYIAMHLIDMHKAGFALPEITPPELAQMCGISRSANNSPMLEPGAPPAQKSPAPKTFEDKRMDNYAKGQAELERRRQVLMEEENRRKAEQERREREEAERRERERLEKERRREAERQAELERQRQIEEARMEEQRRREAEREAARLEAEKQRMIEAEKQKVKELHGMKQQEAERTAQRQQRQKTLSFQLQAMDEKAADTDGEITKARDRIKEITHEIEGMRDVRDEKVKKIAELQATNQQLSIQAQEIAHQLLQFQSANKDTANRKNELEASVKRREAARAQVEQLKAQLEQVRQRSAAQRETTQHKTTEASEMRRKTEAAIDEYRRVLTLLAQTQIQARARLAESDAAMAAALQAQEQQMQQNRMKQSTSGGSGGFEHDPFASSTAAPPVASSTQHSGTAAKANALPVASASGTTKYRALFEFVARSEDELSFQPGDVILVFEGHQAEPGWRAGQIKDKVGWFPEAFAEPIAPVSAAVTQPIQNMPPNVTPSPSLDQIPEETISRLGGLESPKPTSPPAASDVVICQAIAQFPWKARNDDDLSFAKGDLIEVLQQLDMKWRGRKADGSVGWFPKSYVKVQAGTESKPASASQSLDHATPVAGSPAGTPSASTSQRGSIANAAVSASASQHSVSHVATVPNSTSGEWYVAMYEFEATEATDLPLAVGERVLVLEQNDAWWKGRCNGREGIFPANYVQKADGLGSGSILAAGDHHAAVAPTGAVLCHVRAVADFEATAANQLSLKIGDEIGVREKSEAGWWEGEVVRNGQVVAGWFPGDYVVPIEDSSSAIVSPGGGVSATAMFDYTASQADELTFKTGDVIIIDEKVDKEWWTGHLPSAPAHKGLFPANYVQLR